MNKNLLHLYNCTVSWNLNKSILQATGMMDLSDYKNAEAWEAKMIKLIPNYEKVKIILAGHPIEGNLDCR